VSTIQSYSGTVSLDLSALRNFKDNIKDAEKMWIKVGIIGKQNARNNTNGANLDNPTLGLIHEKGSKTRNIPARSFLLMPLKTKLPDQLKQLGTAMWDAITTTTQLKKGLNRIGVQAENIVQQAFATSGFGQWPGWSPRYARLRQMEARRKRRQVKTIGPIPLSILVRSAQLRKSISSKVMGA